MLLFHRKGQYFRLDLDSEENNGTESMLSRQEIYVQLTKICELADQWQKGNYIMLFLNGCVQILGLYIYMI